MTSRIEPAHNFLSKSYLEQNILTFKSLKKKLESLKLYINYIYRYKAII